LSYRHTVSIMEWHYDGSSVMVRWGASPPEREKVRSLLEGRPAIHGFISPQQNRQVSQTARSWKTAGGGTGSRPPDGGPPTHCMLCTGVTKDLPDGSQQPLESGAGGVIYRQTLSILNWHEDGTLTSTVWDVTSEEREQVELLFQCRPVLRRVITGKQGREAQQATKDWLTMPDSEVI
jgi:hypothetical protein